MDLPSVESEIIDFAERLLANEPLDAREVERLEDLLRTKSGRKIYLEYMSISHELDEFSFPENPTVEPAGSDEFNSSVQRSKSGLSRGAKLFLGMAACLLVLFAITSTTIASYGSYYRGLFTQKFLKLALKTYEDDTQSTIELRDSLQSTTWSFFDSSGLHEMQCCQQATEAITIARMGFPLTAIHYLDDAVQLLDRGRISDELDIPVQLIVSKATLEVAEIAGNRGSPPTEIGGIDARMLVSNAYANTESTYQELLERFPLSDSTEEMVILLAALQTDLGRMVIKVWPEPAREGTDGSEKARYRKAFSHLENASAIIDELQESESATYWLQRARLHNSQLLLQQRVGRCKEIVDKAWAIPVQNTRQLFEEIVQAISKHDDETSLSALKLEASICLLNEADVLQDANKGAGKFSEIIELRTLAQGMLETIPLPNRTERFRENFGVCISQTLEVWFEKAASDGEVTLAEFAKLKEHSFVLDSFLGNTFDSRLGQVSLVSRLIAMSVLPQKYSGKQMQSFIDELDGLDDRRVGLIFELRKMALDSIVKD